MANSRHTHTQALTRRAHGGLGDIPRDRFGALVGLLDHVTLSAHDGTRPDDNHVYIWLKVFAGPAAGRYECAFNTESDEGSEVQYFVHEEQITSADFPTTGFHDAQVSYSGLALRQSDFKSIVNGELRSLVYHYAETCDLIAAYGVSYSDGGGIHDIHMNNGEPNGSPHKNHPNQDGAIAFYFRRETAPSLRAWIFVKFASQNLGPE